jgi:hypothetical protein
MQFIPSLAYMIGNYETSLFYIHTDLWVKEAGLRPDLVTIAINFDLYESII